MDKTVEDLDYGAGITYDAFSFMPKSRTYKSKRPFAVGGGRQGPDLIFVIRSVAVRRLRNLKPPFESRSLLHPTPVTSCHLYQTNSCTPLIAPGLSTWNLLNIRALTSQLTSTQLDSVCSLFCSGSWTLMRAPSAALQIAS
jgi:hypothetical protein